MMMSSYPWLLSRRGGRVAPPDKNTFEKTTQQITEANNKGLELTICGSVMGDTGRIGIQIEGSIPKSEAVRFLQIIDSLGGEINAIAG